MSMHNSCHVSTMNCVILKVFSQYLYYSLVPRPASQLISLAGKNQERAWCLKLCDKWTKWHCATLTTKRRFQTYLASLVNKMWLSEVYNDHTTLADNQCSLNSFLLTLNQKAQKLFSPTHTTLAYGVTFLTWL